MIDGYGAEDVAPTTLRRKIAYAVMHAGWKLLDDRAKRGYMKALRIGMIRIKTEPGFSTKARDSE